MDQNPTVRIDVVGNVDGLKPTTAEVERELDKIKGAAQTAGAELSNLAKTALPEVVGSMGEMSVVSESLVSSVVALGAGFVASTVGILAFGAAMKQGHEEQVSMDRALAVSGDYAGMTRDSMRELAKSVSDAGTMTVSTSKEIVTQLVASGRMAGSVVAEVAGLAENYAAVTGNTVETIAPKLISLFSDPAKGAAQLNEQMHFLTAAQLEHISVLVDLGHKEEAQLELSNRLKEVLPDHAKELGLLSTAWENTKKMASEAWDAMLAVGREDDLDTKLKKAREGMQDTWDWYRKIRDFETQAAVYQAAIEKRDSDIAAKKAAAVLAENQTKANSIINQYSNAAKRQDVDRKIYVVSQYSESGTQRDEALKALQEERDKIGKEKVAKTPKKKQDDSVFQAWYSDFKESEKRAAALEKERQKADDLLASYERQDDLAVQRITRGAELAAMSERERTIAEAVYQAQDTSARRQEQIIKQIDDETERTRALNLEKDQLARHIEKVTEASAKSYDDQRTFKFGWDKAFQDYTDNAKNSAATARDAFQSMTSTLEDSLYNFATNTKFTFKDMARSILESLAKVAAKQAAMGLINLGMSFFSPTTTSSGPSAAAGGGSWLGDTSSYKLDGMRAGGGAVAAGGTYLVGEKGPELLRMGSSGGTVVPNEALVGGVSVQQYFSITSSGSSEDSSASSGAASYKQFADRINNAVRQVIVEEMRSGGLLEKARAA